MNRKGYTVLGWLVWQIGSRVAKRKLAHNKAKLVLAGGAVAAKAASGDE